MGSMGLGTLILGAICGIGMIQLIVWIVVVIRRPGFDSILPDFIPKRSSAPRVESPTSRTVAS